MNRVVFLNSFLLCPQKKTIGSIRFITYLSNAIASYSEEELNSLLSSKVMMVRPNQLVDFFKIKMSGVRALLTKETQWLSDASWLTPSGKIEKCFKVVNYVRYQGYYVELNELFLDTLVQELDNAVLIDAEKFGKIDSVYSQVLYGQYITSLDRMITYTSDGLRKIFELEDSYTGDYMLYRKCIKEPCNKLNKIFKLNLDSKKISFGDGDFIWLVASEQKIEEVENSTS